MVIISRSQNCPPEGNGVHFMFEDVSRPLLFRGIRWCRPLFEKSCPTCPFWPICGPRVGQIKKALMFDINNIFSITNQQLLYFEIRLIH